MKKIVLVFALIVVGGSALVLNHVAANTAAKSKTVILRVTSINPKELVSFDASYLFGTKNSKLTHVKQKTPFEIKAGAELVNGVFQKTAGEGGIKVTVSTADEVTEKQLMSGSSNNVVIVGSQPEESQTLQYRFYVEAFDKE